MADKTDYQADAVLTAVKTGTLFVGLFTTLPAAGGAGGVEVIAACTGRKAIVFGSLGAGDPSGRQMSNSSQVLFDQAAEDGGTVVGFGIFDAETSGNLLYFDEFTGEATYAYGIGQQYRCAAGAVLLRES